MGWDDDIYIAVCKNVELLINISIYIYGVHRGGKKPLRKIFMVTILSTLRVYPHYSGWKVNLLVEPFPQCT